MKIKDIGKQNCKQNYIYTIREIKRKVDTAMYFAWPCVKLTANVCNLGIKARHDEIGPKVKRRSTAITIEINIT